MLWLRRHTQGRDQGQTLVVSSQSSDVNSVQGRWGFPWVDSTLWVCGWEGWAVRHMRTGGSREPPNVGGGVWNT